jgi:hypothetical protein
MLGTWFYHKRFRTAVAVFGSMFNNLYVLRKNSAGQTISQVKVPLSYAPKRDFIARLNEMNSSEDAERRVAMKLPRMSFEITSIIYDAQRQLPKMNNIAQAIESAISTTKQHKIFSSAPYTILFQLNVYAKSQDDALQIVEQILPYFAPQYTVTIKPFSDIPSFTEDVPVTIQSVGLEDNYEGAIGDRRTIVYTLDFEMKVNLYGPLNETKIIRDVTSNMYLLGSGIADSDLFYQAINVTPTPSSVSADSDYGFDINYLDSAQ